MFILNSRGHPWVQCAAQVEEERAESIAQKEALTARIAAAEANVLADNESSKGQHKALSQSLNAAQEQADQLSSEVSRFEARGSACGACGLLSNQNWRGFSLKYYSDSVLQVRVGILGQVGGSWNRTSSYCVYSTSLRVTYFLQCIISVQRFNCGV